MRRTKLDAQGCLKLKAHCTARESADLGIAWSPPRHVSSSTRSILAIGGALGEITFWGSSLELLISE
jgi:hypothetical protein